MGLRLASMKSRERSTCPRPSGTRNQVGGTSSICYEDTRKENLSSSVWNEESNTRDFVRQVRSRTNSELVLVRPVCGYNQAGLRLSCTK